MLTETNLYKQSEPTIEQSLRRFSKILPSLGFIRHIYKSYQNYDELKFHQYFAEIVITEKDTDGYLFKDTVPGGCSFFSDELALLKCLGEAVERTSTRCYSNNNLIKGLRKDINNSINPASFSTFSKEQYANPIFSKYLFDDDTFFTWTGGYSLFNLEEIFIPTQMVYYSYRYQGKEGKMCPLISTGAAGGGSLASAILRGIMEVVERDSLMIFYLNKLPGKKIKLRSIKDDRITHILNQCSRYQLTWHVIEITSDLGIPSFASIIIDKTGIGPSVSIGLKSDYYPLNAIIGSFEECLHPRNYARHLYEDTDKKEVKIDQITNIPKRAIYWHKKEMIKQLDFWLMQKETDFIESDREQNLPHGEILKLVGKSLKEKNINCYFVDIARKDVKLIPYFVVKVIMPQLQPLYLNENFPFFGGKRLFEVSSKLGFQSSKTLNPIPHPFL